MPSRAAGNLRYLGRLAGAVAIKPVLLAAVCAIGLLGVGAGFLTRRALVGPNEAAPTGANPAAPAAGIKDPGDPLPPDVLARLGTVRWRHADNLTWADFGPAGKTVISVGEDDTLRVWEIATGRELHRSACHQGLVPCVALAPDRRQVAFWDTSRPGKPRRWITVRDLATGQVRARLTIKPGEDAWGIAWSPDGRVLAVGCSDQRVHFYSTATWQEMPGPAWPPGNVNRLVFSPDGRWLVSLSIHGEVAVADWAARRDVRQLPGKFAAVTFTRDGKLLLATAHTVAVWDPATRRRLRDLRLAEDGADAEPTALAVSADGKILAVGCADHTIRLWDLAAGKPLRRFAAGPGARDVRVLALAPDGRTLVTAAVASHALWLLDAATGRPVFPDAPGQEYPVAAVAVSPDGRLLATDGPGGRVAVWDAATGRPVRQLVGHQGYLRALAFAPDGRMLASAGSDRTVRVWDAATGRERWQGSPLGASGPPAPGSLNKIRYVTFSPDGRAVAAAFLRETEPGIGNGVVLWDAATGRELHRAEESSGLVGALAFAPDSRTVLTIVMPPSADAVLRRRSVQGKESAVRLFAGGGAAAFAPDGTRAVTLQFLADEVQVWDTATGRALVRFRRDGATSCLPALSPDGRYLALCGARGHDPRRNPLVELWELASAKAVCSYRLPTEPGEIHAAAFTPDGRLLTGMADTTSLVWDLSPPRPAQPPASLGDAWAGLAGADARRAWQAAGILAAAPDRTTAFLREHLRPATIDRQRIQRLVADLNDGRLTVRQRAFDELAGLAEVARPALRQALAGRPSLETRRRIEQLLAKESEPLAAGDTLRGVRTVAVLEQLATPSARALLQALAAGAPEARLTQEARASLDRLARRPPTAP